MNWLKSFNETLEFVENNLEVDITSVDIEKVSFSSYHHFCRMFNILSGISLKEYIRKRRLTLAANKLLMTNMKIIDIAYLYQYQTPESFTKAYKKFHELSPSETRKLSKAKTYPKLSFQITIQGGNEMEYEIIKKDNLDFIGFSIDVTTKDGQNFKDIPMFWNMIMQDGRFKALLDNADDLGIVGICYDWSLHVSEFKYMIGIRNKNIELDGAVRISFEPDTFASFKAVGKLPESIQRTTQYIYSEWFPSSNFEHSSGPELEIYPQGNTDSNDYECYYLVPVKQKK